MPGTGFLRGFCPHFHIFNINTPRPGEAAKQWGHRAEERELGMKPRLPLSSERATPSLTGGHSLENAKEHFPRTTKNGG